MNNKGLLYSNTNFSEIPRNDILDFLNLISKFEIPYRDSLNLPSSASFGVEIEYEGMDKAKADKFVNILGGWESTIDSTLESGGEIVSSRLSDEKRVWQDLYLICEILKCNDAKTDKNAGLHVSVGTHLLGRDYHSWELLAKIYMLYERVLVRFAKGDKHRMRDTFIYFARPLGLKMLQQRNLLEKRRLGSIKSFLEDYEENKKGAINFRSLDFSRAMSPYNTFELRLFNSTTDNCVIQNDVNATLKMTLAAANKSVDSDLLSERLDRLEAQKLTGQEYLHQCNNVLLRDAFEFVDLIFDNDLDKVCFLKQYLGDSSLVTMASGRSA